MIDQEQPRIRLHCKQTAKNLWYYDCTVEYKSEHIFRTSDPRDPAKGASDTLGLVALSVIKEAEKVFRTDGRKCVSDLTEMAGESSK